MVRIWVQKAEEDFLVAETLLTPGEFCPFSSVCFHAQQSVEKYIKALPISLSIGFPKVYDIGELLGLLPPTITIPLTTAEQEQLTFHDTEGRYPGDHEPVLREDAEQAVAAARKVREAVRARLPKQTLE